MNLRRASEFFSLPPLIAVGVLALNDHLLKARFHNLVTGKLSDFAGCFFLPLYLSALLAWLGPWSLRARLAIGASATALLFVPIKVSQPAADAVGHAIEVVSVPLGLGRQHIVADPTDLIALVMTGLAVWYAVWVNDSTPS